MLSHSIALFPGKLNITGDMTDSRKALIIVKKNRNGVNRRKIGPYPLVGKRPMSTKLSEKTSQSDLKTIRPVVSSLDVAKVLTWSPRRF